MRNSADVSGFSWNDKRSRPWNESCIISRSCLNSLTSDNGAPESRVVFNFCSIISQKGLQYVVTLNPPVVPNHTLLKWTTGHPVPNIAESKASLELDNIQGKRGIWFCGAYQGYGFHEDGLKAGMVSANNVIRKVSTFERSRASSSSIVFSLILLGIIHEL